ncbi:uncharacterized protein MKZ38_003627 [Zalerion maritima]|uniref:Homeobox domain-containing protein n=1 Tax=Zalerion maritima TaxID=339359 RepID=A0AAD5RMI2_9PEZI|nr:uncharacterized protein MKZ38_003627 [Zalerion maritima]
MSFIAAGPVPKQSDWPCTSSSPPHGDHVDSSFMSTISSHSSNADASLISQVSTASHEQERRRRKRTTRVESSPNSTFFLNEHNQTNSVNFALFCSTQDKAILEAAYQTDTKPDKQARLDIVSRVSMNEKEVQIWFQNRRQNDRRKTRPLSIHEVESLRYRSSGGVHIAPSAATTTADPNPVQDHFAAPYSSTALGHQAQYPATSPGSVAPPHPPPYDPAHVGSHKRGQTTSPEATLPSSRSASPRDGLPNSQLPPPHAAAMPVINSLEASTSNPASIPLPSQATGPDQSFGSVSSCSKESADDVGYLSNRRNEFSSSQPSMSFRPELALPSINSDNNRRRAPLSKLLNDTPSNPFKITLSLEGKAELAPSISPPRPYQPYLTYDTASIPSLPLKLHHAHTHTGNTSNITSLPPISSLLSGAAPPPRLSHGRSRNAQTWEQIADSSDPTPTAVTDSLTTQAEDEASGSARAAITLIRANSSTTPDVPPHHHSPGLAEPPSGVLANNNGKRNSSTASHNARGGKKAKIGRAMSSLASLETPERALEEGNIEAAVPPPPGDRSEAAEKGKKDTTELLVGSPTDSDKENWSPGSTGNPHPHPRRQVPPQRQCRVIEAGCKVLEDSMPVGGGRRLFFGMTTDKSPSKKRMSSPGVSIFEDARSSDDHVGSDRDGEKYENTNFGRGRRGGNAKGEEDDVAAHSFDVNISSDATIPDEEVERFMRGDVSPSKKGDADAVHSLLSLKSGWSS